jgi:hypothetical protein
MVSTVAPHRTIP